MSIKSNMAADRRKAFLQHRKSKGDVVRKKRRQSKSNQDFDLEYKSSKDKRKQRLKNKMTRKSRKRNRK